jgi:Ca-activated chloride channel family protein
MYFENYGTNPFVDTRHDYQSTFAIDIDDASYNLCRSYLERSTLPPVDAIRVEEFINHFDYNYAQPDNETFAVYAEGAPSRFGDNSQLLRIGIKGKSLDSESRKPSSIVFVVDGSGSMNEGSRITLVTETLKHIINRAGRDDVIGIVAYNHSAVTILEPTSARNKAELYSSLERLFAYGSTNVQAGLRLGFRMSWRAFDANKNNCVILFSDGVANVGVTDADALIKETKGYAQKGITLATIGVGMGNYNDILMEKLGDNGNGFYAYVDSFEEARRLFEKNLSGSLQAIARDVKVQVEFDPDVVQSYRLLGYENRAVADYHFRNDKVDGGEITPGHSVTALYEIHLNNRGNNRGEKSGHSGNLGRVFVRYKNPETGHVEEITKPIGANVLNAGYSRCSADFKLVMAAAEFAEIMRDSFWARNSNLESVRQLASEVYHQTRDDKVLELVQLITKARDLKNIESDYFSG